MAEVHKLNTHKCLKKYSTANRSTMLNSVPKMKYLVYALKFTLKLNLSIKVLHFGSSLSINTTLLC